jgi:hypothetical protein
MTAQTETNYKSTLAEIEAGDFVVVHNSGYGGGYTLKSVDRATKTQITVGNTKFNRNGNEIGGGARWHKDYIHAPLQKYYEDRTMLEVAEADMAKRAEKAKRTELTKTINDKLGSASIDTLQKVVELLNA